MIYFLHFVYDVYKYIFILLLGSTFLNNMNNRRSAKTIRRITKDDLIFLVDKNDFALLDEVNRREYGFIAYLEKCRYCEQKESAQILEIIIRILNRICSLRGQKTFARVQRFLRMLRNCDKFLFDDLPSVINSSLTQNKGINLVSFMANYTNVLKMLLRQDFFPCSRIINEVFPALENYMNRMRERNLRNLAEAEECFNRLRYEVERYENPSTSDDDDDDNEIRNFRDLSIVPRSNDIVNYEVTKIPQNIVDSAYKSVDHYLSVHFRLIREDMLRSFRECIKICIFPGDRKSTGQNKNQFYEKVSVKFPPEYGVNGIFYDIKLNTSKEVDWSERSEKGFLKPGSLVFLTPDRFQSVIFATVVNNPKAKFSKSKECEIKIKLEDDTFCDKLEDLQYQMIEPDAYFECYKHVLSGIKEFYESNFPLEDIIVYLDFKDPEICGNNFNPEYLHDVKYCLHEKCDGKLKDDSTCPCKVFDPLNDEEWPSADELELDEKQFIAFKTAITKKVAVIQGPPGTGKTYVGSKVVKALLENNPGKPIVICCMTNHALDQFLERILELSTKKIVRLGSQSKSKVLEPHKLENIFYAIREYRVEKNVSDNLKDSYNLVKCMAEVLLDDKIREVVDEEVAALRKLSKTINMYLKFHYLCKEKYLDESALNDIIPKTCKNQLRTKAGSILKSLSDGVLEWLLCSRVSDLYVKCDRKFETFRKEKLEFPTKIRDVWTLCETDRFKLFFVWREKCLMEQQEFLDENIDTYKKLMRGNRAKSVDSDKLEILRSADIIGVTTTGACKFKDLIRFSEPQIIVVEEAAQVLEAHIIASLLPTIQHLILIGDHEQLRPLPANHELSEKYNLKISMFERLFKNGAPSATLVSQHRMKPCIAELLVPVPYETYSSYKNVYEYQEIRGVNSSVFFFEHQKLEDQNSSGKSSSNDFEARIIINFAKYLLLQSYSVKDITIIATYGAQVALILSYLSRETNKLNGIHVTTVDNFQGEENNIILISFVRSNPSVIGFLKESNRVCVALSRAKMGMFCFGNFQHFADKSQLWANIVEKLRMKNMISDTLPLKCERHKVLYPVKSDTDISTFIDRGCSQMCNFLLPCQHICTRKCHFYDSDHLQYLCKQPCEKMIDENRVCPRLCYERCKRLKKKQIQLPCGHMSSGDNTLCNVETQRLLPCNHLVTVPCHLDMVECKAAVEIKLNCGHNKTIYCHEQKEKINIICMELRPELGPCGHIVKVPCALSLDENELFAFCDKACGALLDCGHACVSFCRVCFDIGIHGLCVERCDLVLSCGHQCEGTCYSPCPPCSQECFLICAHGTKCINACLRSCIDCKEPCARACEHGRCTNLCYEECSIEPCMEPCSEILPCGHPCIGLCGDPCPYLCRICQKDDLKISSEDSHFIQLECDHVIEVNELTGHIENCLICLDWPHCPQCLSAIKCSLRFKNQLAQTKERCIESCDTSSDVAEIRYLEDSMYGQDYIVPARFLPIHKRIMHILKRKSPRSDTLLVLKNCVMLLKKLVNIAPRLEKFQSDERIQSRFETLLIWLGEHLTKASYQQLRELESSLDQLTKDVS